MYFFFLIELGEKGEGDEVKDIIDGVFDVNGISCDIEYL